MWVIFLREHSSPLTAKQNATEGCLKTALLPSVLLWWCSFTGYQGVKYHEGGAQIWQM